MPKSLWHLEEEKLLKKLYPKYREGLIGSEDLAKIFIGKSPQAIIEKIHRMKLTNTYTPKPKINMDYLHNLQKTIKI